MKFLTIILFFITLSLSSLGQVDNTEIQKLELLKKQLELQKEIIQLQKEQREASILEANTTPGVKSKNGNTFTERNATVLTSNFTVPVVRFNFLDKNQGAELKEGNVSLFNSIGAGININRGRLTSITDNKNEEISNEFKNIVGGQMGVLFSSNSTNGTNSNVFALTFGVTLLNFQVGYGIELGSLTPNEKRGFMTIAYGIPLTSFVQGAMHIISSSSLKNEKDPSQSGGKRTRAKNLLPPNSFPKM